MELLHGHVGTGKRLSREYYQVSRMTKIALTMIAFVMLCPSYAELVADDISSQTMPYFDQLYIDGVKAYKDQLWYKCAHNLEKAIAGYKGFQKVLTDCRIDCKNGVRKSNLDNFITESGDFSVFESFLKHADCFRRCKSELYSSRPGYRMSREIEDIFLRRKPYQYLQYCWYKLDRVKQAASAAYTYFLANSREEDAHRNVAFYREKARIPDTDFIDLELTPYKEHYIRAMLAYTEEDWTNVVEHLEKSLDSFFQEEKHCRANCEDRLEEYWGRKDFAEMVADQVLKILECQLGCEGNLSVIYSDPIEGFLADQFHYLQYAYFKIGRISEAVEATASFLLFHPNDTAVGENKRIFLKKYHYSEEQFVPRKDIRQYMEQKKTLSKLLGYLTTNYKKEPEEGIYLPDDRVSAGSPEEEAASRQTREYEAWMERYEKLGLHVIAKSSDLKRSHRFAADGLLKSDQCEDLLDLTVHVPVDEKGVQTFTLEHAREAVLTADESYEASLRLFMRATEVIRHYIQRFYNISGSLYFKNTIIVCWTQVPAPKVEKDCIPQEFGTCLPEPEVLASQVTEGQFVSVTYLNTQDDSDVFFLSENGSFDTSLGVRCGRTVGFQYGDRHGLSLSSPGRRCAMVTTYLLHRNPDEMEYIKTMQILQRLEEKRMEAGLSDAKEVLQKLEKAGVKVAKNATDLLGKERVVADGLATNAECTSLKNMVMELGKAGDGYGGQRSPHTRNELFEGLTLAQVSQSGALIGDGYDHLLKKPSNISPHTPHEMFQGLTMYRAAKLMHMGVVNTFSMKALLDLSEKSRLFIEKYFNLTRPLYFDFTHLVCRSAIDNSLVRDDLSHPVHADNCVLQPNGTCLKEYPAFIQRDYSGILYLNNDFEGGDFFFAYPNRTEQVSVQPKCGRLVGFNAADFHGVKAVKKGVRCALALWFTLNPNFKELAHVHAKKVLKTIQKEREAEEKLHQQQSPDDSLELSSSDASNSVVNNNGQEEMKDAEAPQAVKSGTDEDISIQEKARDNGENRAKLLSESETHDTNGAALETVTLDTNADVVSQTEMTGRKESSSFEIPDAKDGVSNTRTLGMKDVSKTAEARTNADIRLEELGYTHAHKDGEVIKNNDIKELYGHNNGGFHKYDENLEEHNEL